MKILKYLMKIITLRQVAHTYREEKGKGKPIYLSRRFVGVVIGFVSAVLAIHFGVTIDKGLIDSITEQYITIATAATTLYGVIMVVIGHFKRAK